MSSEKLRKTVQLAARAEAFIWLSKKKANSEKVKHIPHGRLATQEYLSKPILSVEQSKFLFHLRSRMIFVRKNYSKMQKESTCPLCSTEEKTSSDSQEHLLECTKLTDNSSEISEQGLKYSDIFSQNSEKQAKMTIILENKYKRRKLLLASS